MKRMALLLVAFLLGCQDTVPRERIELDTPVKREVESIVEMGEVRLVQASAQEPEVSQPEVLPASVAAGRRVHRWGWRASVDARARAWNIPRDESEQAVAEGLLRMCVSEANWECYWDGVGIWQVVQNVRSRSCDRERIPLITECDEGGETHLSAMRRLSRHVMGMAQPNSRRQRWVSSLTLGCERPAHFPGGLNWKRDFRGKCKRIAELATSLVSGELDLRVAQGVPIAWGGRCEEGDGACDDHIACNRGLARARTTRDTLNAFWCRPGTRGCPPHIDPVCEKFGFSVGKEADEPDRLSGTEPEIESHPSAERSQAS